MTWWQSLILGIVEGLTEYLPVSSTGHLIVAQRLMGIGTGLDKTAADYFAICIQAGAIAAVLGLYWKHVKQMLEGLLGKNPEGLKLLINVVAGFLPAAVVGLIANAWIEDHLFNMKCIAVSWLTGGVAIPVVDQWMKKGGGSRGKLVTEMTVRMAVIIGLAQCLAMLPGTSRSLVTILGGLLVGMRLSAAVEFSFLLGLLTLTAATAKKIVGKVPEEHAQALLGTGMPHADKYGHHFGGALLMWDTYGPQALAIGVVAAAIFAAISVRWMVGYLNRRGLGIFGWYRIVIGIAAVAAIYFDYKGLSQI